MAETEGVRKLDLAAKASINVVDLNNKVVLMRKVVRRAKIFVVRGLARKVQSLKKKKGNETEKQQNMTKANKLVEEIRLIYSLKADYVSKYALGSTEKFQELICKPTTTMEMRALARLAENKVIQDVVKEFREQHPDWKDLAAYLMTKHTSREFKRKKTKLKMSKVKVNVGASETLIKAYLSSKVGAGDDEKDHDNDTMNIEEGSEAVDGDESENDSNDSDDSESSRGQSFQQLDNDEEDEEEDDNSHGSDDSISARRQALQHMDKDVYDDDEKEEEEEGQDALDSDDYDSEQGEHEGPVDGQVGDDEDDGESSVGEDSNEEEIDESGSGEESDNENSDSEDDVEEEEESSLEEITSSDLESKVKTDTGKCFHNKAKSDQHKLKTISKLVFQSVKEEEDGSRKRTILDSEKSHVCKTKDVEKKSGEMIVKRLKLTEDNDQDNGQVPEILLGESKGPVKSSKKWKDPFFDSGVNNDSEGDDKPEHKSKDKKSSKDFDKTTKFDFMSEKEMGLQALSTTFLGSLSSSKMMQCTDPAYRTNAEWKQLRTFSDRQEPGNFRGRNRGGLRGSGEFRGRGRGDFRGQGRGREDFRGPGRGNFRGPGRGRGDFRGPGRGRGDFRGRGRGDFRGQGRGRGDFRGPGRGDFQLRGRGDTRGRGRDRGPGRVAGSQRGSFSRGDRRGDLKGPVQHALRQDKGKPKSAEKSGPIHPSWEASQKRKQMAASIHTYTGTKITFDD